MFVNFKNTKDIIEFTSKVSANFDIEIKLVEYINIY